MLIVKHEHAKKCTYGSRTDTMTICVYLIVL